MKYLPIFSLIILAACGQPHPVKLKATKAANFFENSQRLNAEVGQQKGLGRLGGCTGFFLKNSENKNLLATARHCMRYDAPAWCAAGNTVREDASGLTLRCRSVAVGDERHDLVIFELEEAERDRSLDFTLANFALTPSMRLAMLGYPGDQYNPERNLKLTQNCWVIRPTSTNIYDDPNVAADKVFTHNCSTYGGNSGGPMFVEGTRVAIGIPDTYAPGDFSQRDRNGKAAQGVLAAGFVTDFITEIETHGITLTNTAPTPRIGDYPREGRFSAGGACVVEVQRVSYNTHVSGIQMRVALAPGCETVGELTLSCHQNMECVHPSGHLQLKWQGGERFLMDELSYQRL